MEPIFVTRPNLPSLNKFTEHLKCIWKKKWLTNQGEYHQDFEKKLCEYLGAKQCNLFCNGTLALLIGLQSLRITGEVITTPFSFVATSHSLKWNGIAPIFCDIEEKTLNLDPKKIEALITNKTTALLPVHVYGHPCNVKAIEEIANTYGLKIIYDAAHAFGVKINGEPISNYGDISVLSFHATKVFNTIEGGAIVSNNEHLKRRIDFLKNFGFADETTVIGTGINAKMNEIQAAYGLLQLEIIDKEIRKRKKIAEAYRRYLSQLEGIRFFDEFDGIESNYSYFPILIDLNKYGRDRDYVYEKLKEVNIFTRKYFFPLITQFPPYRNLPSANTENLVVAEKIAKQVLCLPIYGDLSLSIVEIICDKIWEFQK